MCSREAVAATQRALVRAGLGFESPSGYGRGTVAQLPSPQLADALELVVNAGDGAADDAFRRVATRARGAPDRSDRAIPIGQLLTLELNASRLGVSLHRAALQMAACERTEQLTALLSAVELHRRQIHKCEDAGVAEFVQGLGKSHLVVPQQYNDNGSGIRDMVIRLRVHFRADNERLPGSGERRMRRLGEFTVALREASELLTAPWMPSLGGDDTGGVSVGVIEETGGGRLRQVLVVAIGDAGLEGRSGGAGPTQVEVEEERRRLHAAVMGARRRLLLAPPADTETQAPGLWHELHRAGRVRLE